MRAATVVPGRPERSAVSELPDPTARPGQLLVRGLLAPRCYWVRQARKILKVQSQNISDISLLTHIRIEDNGTQKLSHRHPCQSQIGKVMILPTSTDLQ